MVLPKPHQKPPAALLRGVLGYPQRFKALDVGANPLDGGTPVYAILLGAGDIDLVGFEPDPKALAALNDRKGPNEIYLPHAVGDGDRHTLHLCRVTSMNSLLEPDQAVLRLFHLYPQWGEVLERKEVETVRLDDIPETAGADFLKMDIQGAELLALKGATGLLKNMVAIQAETNFVPLYKDQATFAEVAIFLKQHGFMLHRFIGPADRMLSPFAIDGDPLVVGSQAAWADAVFVRDLTRLDLLTDRQLLVLATIAYDFYQSFDLVLLLLAEYDRRNSGILAGKFLFDLQPYFHKRELRMLNFEMVNFEAS